MDYCVFDKQQGYLNTASIFGLQGIQSATIACIVYCLQRAHVAYAPSYDSLESLITSAAPLPRN